MFKSHDFVKKFSLSPHPEGGFYRQTYRSSESVELSRGSRPIATAIYFFLEKGNISRLHRIQSDELWHHYDGDPLEILELSPRGEIIRTVLGKAFNKGQVPQYGVKAGHWFGSRVVPGGEYSFVGCTVSPGFDFADFEMGKKEELLSLFPHALKEIEIFS